ncbi:acylneuraminate cytidylyltransferase family protein [Kineobactrum sediminis]|uniref:Acylneuraminate cytidylyltransferase family protein n=1 Tax=Kineobactrum sediminis TaxID=1905677 RepID=A0A2N5Y119_9GAMM|nr:acylneuraminate cytidylyltransferase family protein [Kineobactrum sediminis]PLW82086.1 acylneuraminate cytidylyltransferase family protein [Kineobactrum sediminis]
MDDSHKVLMVIPARGGSRRLPRKNILPLAGKPLICWSIETALATSLDARILVTSDDDEILSLAQEYAEQGVIAHKRPDELATDTATTADVLIDAIKAEHAAGYAADILILLQPTSPLRNTDDILAAVKVFEETGCSDTVVSVCEVDHPTSWVGVIDDHSTFSGVDLSGNRSQGYRIEYRLNGAVYVARAETLMNKKTLFTDRLRASIMPRARSFDIDEPVDFRVCETFVSG